MNPRDLLHSCSNKAGGAEEFSLAPAEGERAGVRGNGEQGEDSTSNIEHRTTNSPLTLTLSPAEGENEVIPDKSHHPTDLTGTT